MGGNGIPALNTLAGQLMTTAVVLLAIALAWAIVRFASGSGLGKESKSKGAAGITICLVGAVIIGSTGAAIEWGSTAAKPNTLMGGDDINIRVEKEPAKTTCENTVETRFKKTDQKDTSDKLVKTLVSEVDYANYMDETEPGVTTSVAWTPKGPDCTSENTVAEPCTVIAVSDIHVAAPALSKSYEYKGPSNKACS